MIPAFNESLLDYVGEGDLEVVGSAYITAGQTAAGALNMQPAKLRLLIGPGRRPAQPPMISCLMPTKGRVEQAKVAIGCYRRQTWPNRELVVIDQNPDGKLAAWIASLNDPSIRVFSMPGLMEPLGTIRNRSIDLAAGAAICAWDDDDLQHPARLEIAMLAMLASKASACTLIRETVWMPSLQRVGIRQLWPYCNTILALRSAGLRYLPLPVGEDIPAVHGLIARQRAILIDLPELYLYVMHGTNTVSATYLEGRWNNSTDRTEGAESRSSLDQLARAFPIAEYTAALAAQEPQPPRVVVPPPARVSLLGHTTDADVTITTDALLSGESAADGTPTYTPARLNLSIGPSHRKGALPLISCLMPTRDRFDLAKLAIGCFRRQTWPNRELIVLDQSSDDRLGKWIAALDDPTIRVFAMPGLQEPLGAIRNRSMDLAAGDLLCVWDDDDLHHPLRLEVGAAAIAATGAAASMLMAETIWTARPSRVGVLVRMNENTLLVRRDPEFRYPPLPRGSDTIAVKELLRRRQAVLVDLPELYVYVLHGQNTWDESHTEKLWRATNDKAEGAAAERALGRLAQAYPIAEYAAIAAAERPPLIVGEDLRRGLAR